MSFLQSVLTEKQLANVIFFGVWLGPLVVSGIVAQVYLQAADHKERVASLRALRAEMRRRETAKADVFFL